MLGFARRRVDEHDAVDVVADTFLVAWRRSVDIPEEPLPWLLGVAGKVIATKRRSKSRRSGLQAKVESHARPETSLRPTDRLELADAFRSLSANDREVLMLVAWDGLDVRQAAQVLGCTAASFSLQLHRARKRLEIKLAPESRTPKLTPKVEECS